MYELNYKFLDGEQYKEVLDTDADYKEDFAGIGLDIMPTANPEMSSKFQRIQQAEAGLQQLPLLMQAGSRKTKSVKVLPTA